MSSDVANPVVIPVVTGHAAVRAALRDHGRYSSDLQGDRDVRTYKQLPLEVDPPDHGKYRAILGPLFSADRVDSLRPALRQQVSQLLDELIARGECDAVMDLSLELVVRCLGIVLGRPGDVDEWRSWGPDVWISTPQGRSGAHLQAYLEATFADVSANPSDDAFSVINAAEVDGRPLTETEKHGIANIILAGGRDTVVKVMTGFIWHLAQQPQDYDFLAEDFGRIPRAIDELVRFLSPLPAMERIDTSMIGLSNAPGYTWISFASANHDTEVFENPSEVNLARHPNPHMGFGGGPHACIGNLVAKAETRALLEEIFSRRIRWQMGADAHIDMTRFGTSEVPGRFHRLPIRFIKAM